MKWCAVPNPAGYDRPQWQRSAALAEDGTVFVPATVGGNEQAIFLSAGFDNVPIVMDSGHVFVPARWLARECPSNADICDLIERRVKDHFGATP